MKIAIPTLAAVLLAAGTSLAFAQTPATPAPSTVPNATTEPSHEMGHMKSGPHSAVHRGGLTAKQVEAVQAALASNGQTVDKDGRMGPKTVAALKEFQKSHGLKATGRIDKQTAGKLNLPQPI